MSSVDDERAKLEKKLNMLQADKVSVGTESLKPLILKVGEIIGAFKVVRAAVIRKEEFYLLERI